MQTSPIGIGVGPKQPQSAQHVSLKDTASTTLNLSLYTHFLSLRESKRLAAEREKMLSRKMPIKTSYLQNRRSKSEMNGF
jgi:hypothetical protein